MREQYAAEQNITIGTDGCCTAINMRMHVTFTADASEGAETVEVTRLSFYATRNGYRGDKAEMPGWVHDLYLSSHDLKDWLQSFAVKIEERAKADAKLAEVMS